MKFQVDGKTVDLCDVDPASAFLQTLTDLQIHNRALRQITLNGVEIDSIDLEQIVKQIVAGQIHSLEILSVDSRVLLMESVSMARDLFAQLAEGLTYVALAWQRGDDEKAFNAFSSSLDGLHSLLSLWEMLIGQEVIAVAHATSIYNGLSEWIQSLQVAWERYNVVYMSDILLYEICPLLQQGMGLLDAVAQAQPE